ncbi:P1 family peptidase [Streptomyces lasalocidi]
MLEDGIEIEVVVAVNAVGDCVCRKTGRLYGSDTADLRVALPDEIAALPGPHAMPLATTIGVVLINVSLTKAQAQKVSGIAHDGMARAIRPVHTMFDGDSVFTLATGVLPAPGPQQYHALLTAAADTFQRAVVDAMLAAESVGPFLAYRDVVPSLTPSRG